MKLKELLRRASKSKFFIVGMIVVTLIIVLALISPYIIVHNPEQADLRARLLSPEYLKNGWGGYILGTDALGQDMLSRLLIGSRTSLLIAFLSVLGGCVMGTALGVLSGYYRGICETVIMRVCDVQMTIPPLILALCVLTILGNQVSNLVLVIIISTWVTYARLVRGNVLTIRNMEYIQASKVLGASNFSVMLKQVLPNVLNSLIILTSQQFGIVILLEANLSFLGMGVPVPTPSWGSMIGEGREYIATAPWVVIVPGLALMITTLAFNFLGDGIRDILDPKNTD